MKKVSTKTLIAATFLTGVVGLSSLPLGAGAMGYNNWQYQNNHWQYQNNRRDRDDDRYRVSDWQAQQIARHHHHRDVHHEERYRDRDDDVIIVVVFVDGCHTSIRERDGAFLGSYYR